MSLAQVIAERTAKKPKKLRLVARGRGVNGSNGAEFKTGKTDKAQNFLFQYLPAAARAWVDGLSACKSIWNPDTKAFEETNIADHKIRGDCAEKIWHNVVGRPIERSMALTGNYKELSELVDELKKSPEAQRLIAGGFFDQLLRQDSEPEGQKPSVETQSSE
jgi:hypothetical protein